MRLHPTATIPSVNFNGRRYWSFHLLLDVQFSAFQDLYNAALLTEYPDQDGYVWKTPEHGALEENMLELEIASKRWAAIDATRPSAPFRAPHPDQVPALRPITPPRCILAF